MRNRWQKNFKTFNHKWEYTLDVCIKIRKGDNRHKKFSQVYKNYNILTSVFYLVIRYLNSCFVTTDVTFNGSLNITTWVWAFFLLADYYFIAQHLLSDTSGIIFASWCLIRQLQPEPTELYREAGNVPLCRLQSTVPPASAPSATWDPGSSWQSAITVGLVEPTWSSLF